MGKKLIWRLVAPGLGSTREWNSRNIKVFHSSFARPSCSDPSSGQVDVFGLFVCVDWPARPSSMEQAAAMDVRLRCLELYRTCVSISASYILACVVTSHTIYYTTAILHLRFT